MFGYGFLYSRLSKSIYLQKEYNQWVEIVGSIVIMLGVVYLIFLFLSTFGFEVKQSTNIEDSWGIPFLLAMAVLIGQFSALLINISDYTRYFPRKSNTGTFVGAHIVGIVPPMILLPFVGILKAAAVRNLESC